MWMEFFIQPINRSYPHKIKYIKKKRNKSQVPPRHYSRPLSSMFLSHVSSLSLSLSNSCTSIILPTKNPFPEIKRPHAYCNRDSLIVGPTDQRGVCNESISSRSSLVSKGVWNPNRDVLWLSVIQKYCSNNTRHEKINWITPNIPDLITNYNNTKYEGRVPDLAQYTGNKKLYSQKKRTDLYNILIT